MNSSVWYLKCNTSVSQHACTKLEMASVAFYKELLSSLRSQGYQGDLPMLMDEETAVVLVLIWGLLSGLVVALFLALGTEFLLLLVPGVDVLLRRLKDGSTDGTTVFLTGLLAALIVAAAGLGFVLMLPADLPLEVYFIVPAVSAALMLAWWTDVTRRQTRARVGRQCLLVRDNLLELKSAAGSALKDIIAAQRDAICKMQEACKDAHILSRQQAETAALIQAMQARITALEGQLRGTKEGLEDVERRRVAGARELRGRVEKGEQEVTNMRVELATAKWEWMRDSVEAKEEWQGELGSVRVDLEEELETVKEELGKLKAGKEEVEGELVAVKGELIAMKGELVTIKGQLIRQKDGLGKEGVDVKAELAASGRSAAVEQGESSQHEELAVDEQLKPSKGDVSSVWQKIQATTTLDLKGQPNLSDALLTHVATMTHLKHVHIDSSSGITSQGIKCLFSLPHLESLELKGSVVTDCTLEGIGAAISTLKFLYLNQAAVTNAGLPHLAALTSLKTLILYKCEGVTCAGMVLVGRMASLEELYLFGSGVKDYGLRFLSPLTWLKMLVLPSSITDAGVDHMQQLTALELLDISNSVVTKKGAKLLKGLPSLKHVRAGSASLQLLRSALPAVVVSKYLLPGAISGDANLVDSKSEPGSSTRHYLW